MDGINLYDNFKIYNVASYVLVYVLPESLEGTFKVKCRHCNKVIPASTKVFTNWLKHMVRHILINQLVIWSRCQLHQHL